MYKIYAHKKPGNIDFFYIGQSNNNTRPFSKWYRNNYWHNIVNKYGGFDVSILATNLTKFEEIGRLDLGTGTLVNMTDGGEGNKGLIFSNEHKRKISESSKGKKMSKQSRTKMSIIQTKLWKELSEETKIIRKRKFKHDTKHTIETKNKISVSLTGKKLSEKTKIKMSQSKLNKQLSLKHKKNISDSLKNCNSIKKCVLQYSLNGSFLNEYDSALQALQILGKPFNSTGISKCCNKSNKTAYGFIWKFKNKINN